MNVAQARVDGHSSVCCFASSLGGHEGHVMFFSQHGAARVGIYCVCCAELVSSACVGAQGG